MGGENGVPVYPVKWSIPRLKAGGYFYTGVREKAGYGVSAHFGRGIV